MRSPYHLYLVTTPREGLLSIVLRAVQGGVGMVQLRDKDCSDQHFIETAKNLQEILPVGFPILINDRLSVAKAVGVGLHVGMGDVSPVEARKVLGEEAVIGLTIHHQTRLAIQFQQYIDYVGVGPVFTTQTKLDASEVLGTDSLHRICMECPVPVVAIGGIVGSNVRRVRECGVAGVAVCSAIMHSTDPERTAGALC